MTLLNKGPSNSDFADGPLLCVECLLRACVRISYMRARARFLVLLNCYMNYLFLSFFRVGRAFFKVEYIINCVIFVPDENNNCYVTYRVLSDCRLSDRSSRFYFIQVF